MLPESIYWAFSTTISNMPDRIAGRLEVPGFSVGVCLR
jgi:hypothetical protein